MAAARVWACCMLLAAASTRELDPAACAARFDVQRDKIIRTEESRGLGARYLVELDVGTLQECLRFCCETDSCDVFVFEEKSPGSCYLFNCGPPEDFRCKFTAHGNFSSGVLALSRRLAELQDQQRLASHERQLASLRGTSSTVVSPAARSMPPPPPPPQPQPQRQPQPPQPQPPPQQQQQPQPQQPQLQQPQPQQPQTQQPQPPAPHVLSPPSGRCSRYQFECRRGGECLAVYNACDGVAQCPDGSDEAPELGCPAPPAPHSPPAPPATPPPPPPPPPRLTQQLQPQESAEDTEGGSEMWPHRLTQAQPQHRFNAGGGSESHIFSHKGGLVQEAAFEPPADWPRRAWAAPANDERAWSAPVNDDRIWGAPAPGERAWAAPASGERAWAAPASGERAWAASAPGERAWAASAPEERPWAAPASADRAWAAFPRPAWPDVERRRGLSVPHPEPERQAYNMSPKTMLEMPVEYAGEQRQLHDSPKKGFELQRVPAPPASPAPAPDAAPAASPAPASAPAPGVARVSPNTEITPKITAAVHDLVERRQAGPGLARLATDDHDGLAEQPPAAMLLLVLGLLMTVMLGTLLGCRARLARRRRPRPRMALDPDYLVNGMYL